MRLWSTFNTLLGRRRVQAECTSGVLAFTAEDFLTSHTTKILGIRQATVGSPPPHHCTTNCSLSSFNEVTAEELRRIIIGSPIPTYLLQEHVDLLLPIFTKLCNQYPGGYLATVAINILIPTLKND